MIQASVLYPEYLLSGFELGDDSVRSGPRQSATPSVLTSENPKLPQQVSPSLVLDRRLWHIHVNTDLLHQIKVCVTIKYNERDWPQIIEIVGLKNRQSWSLLTFSDSSIEEEHQSIPFSDLTSAASTINSGEHRH